MNFDYVVFFRGFLLWVFRIYMTPNLCGSFLPVSVRLVRRLGFYNIFAVQKKKEAQIEVYSQKRE
jgi:hypothetical protein